MTIKIFGEDCSIYKYKYHNGRNALSAFDAMGFPMAKLSVNLPDEEISDNEIAIKDYAENTGVLDVLIKNKVIGEVIRYVDNGFVIIPICKILI